MNGKGDSAFDQQQFNAIYPEGIERHYWNRCRNEVIAAMLDRIDANGPMLEVGCGRGLVVKALRKKGFAITGVELAEVEPVPGSEEHIRTSTDALFMDDAEASTIRTILLLDVIEHMEDPASFLGGLRSKFPALEWLVVTVPARQELFSNYDVFNRHFRRYDIGSLRGHIEPSNNGTWHVRYFFHALYPAARLLLWLIGERKPYFSVPAKGLPSLIHAVLGSMFVMEYKLLPRDWFGTSLIAAVQEVSPKR